MRQYNFLLQSFENWLKTLEYAQSTVYGSVRYLEDFLVYLQQNNIQEIEQIDKQVIKNYHEYLQTRKNKRTLLVLEEEEKKEATNGKSK